MIAASSKPIVVIVGAGLGRFEQVRLELDKD
jgi:hypothetical protein